MARKKLGEILIDAGLIDHATLRAALAEQSRWGGQLGQVLINLRMVAETDLVNALSQQLNFPIVDLDQQQPARDVLELVPADLALQYYLVPFNKVNRFLDIAMFDPTNIIALDDLRIRTKLNIRPHLSGPKALERALARFYNRGPGLLEMSKFTPPPGGIPDSENMLDLEGADNAHAAAGVDSEQAEFEAQQGRTSKTIGPGHNVQGLGASRANNIDPATMPSMGQTVPFTSGGLQAQSQRNINVPAFPQPAFNQNPQSMNSVNPLQAQSQPMAPTMQAQQPSAVWQAPPVNRTQMPSVAVPQPGNGPGSGPNMLQQNGMHVAPPNQPLQAQSMQGQGMVQSQGLPSQNMHGQNMQGLPNQGMPNQPVLAQTMQGQGGGLQAALANQNLQQRAPSQPAMSGGFTQQTLIPRIPVPAPGQHGPGANGFSPNGRIGTSPEDEHGEGEMNYMQGNPNYPGFGTDGIGGVNANYGQSNAYVPPPHAIAFTPQPVAQSQPAPSQPQRAQSYPAANAAQQNDITAGSQLGSSSQLLERIGYLESLLNRDETILRVLLNLLIERGVASREEILARIQAAEQQ